MRASRGSQGELVVSKNRFQGTPPGSIVMKTTMMITVALSSPLLTSLHCFLSRDFGANQAAGADRC